MTNISGIPSGARNRVAGPFVRFLLSGGFNTATTYLLYLALIRFLPYRLGYTIAFVSGIALAYGLNRFFVFRTHGGLAAMVLTPVIYVVQYLLGIAILWIWVEAFSWPVPLAPLAAVVLTIPFTFLASRRTFRGAIGGNVPPKQT